MRVTRADVLRAVEESDGFRVTDMLDATQWGDLSKFENWHRRNDTRLRILKHIAVLRAQGYIVETDPGVFRACETITPRPRYKMTRITVDYQGEQWVLTELCKAKGLDYFVIYERIRDGWSVEEAIETPKLRRGRRRRRGTEAE